eukprot:1938607-Amphidinium_carterae.2
MLSTKKQPTLHEGQSLDDHTGLMEACPAQDGDGIGGEAGTAVVVADTTDPQSTAGHDRGVQQHLSLAALNARDRRMAHEWLQTSPTFVLVLMMVALLPLDRLLHKLFQLGSEAWERKQVAEACRSHNTTGQAARNYRLVLAANREVEGEFTTDLKDKYFSKGYWDIFPTCHYELVFQHKAFKLLARVGAVIHLGMVEHQTYPTKLFLVLADRSWGTVLAKDKDCIKDKYTLSLQSMCSTLDSDEIVAALTLHAASQKLDIANIEARHASVRRQIQTRSQQTWTASLAQISGEWLLQNHRCASVKPGLKKVQKQQVLGLKGATH